MITHLSFPHNNSVNDFIDPDISQLGRGALLGKLDIKSAFRLLPVFPGDFDLLGFQFEGKIYIEKMTPMGCSVSPSLFEEFSMFLHWLVHNICLGLTVY